MLFYAADFDELVNRIYYAIDESDPISFNQFYNSDHRVNIFDSTAEEWQEALDSGDFLEYKVFTNSGCNFFVLVTKDMLESDPRYVKDEYAGIVFGGFVEDYAITEGEETAGYYHRNGLYSVGNSPAL